MSPRRSTSRLSVKCCWTSRASFSSTELASSVLEKLARDVQQHFTLNRLVERRGDIVVLERLLRSPSYARFAESEERWAPPLVARARPVGAHEEF